MSFIISQSRINPIIQGPEAEPHSTVVIIPISQDNRYMENNSGAEMQEVQGEGTGNGLGSSRERGEDEGNRNGNSRRCNILCLKDEYVD